LSLNREQSDVVAQPIGATVKVLAGAGTGKTGVLVDRYLRFVLDDGVSPATLLALTFTKKAAAEMQRRVFEEALKRDRRDVLRSLHGAWIMNFHQFAYRVIKENAAYFGIDPDIAVASAVDLARLRRRLNRRYQAGGIEGIPENYEEDVPPNTIDKRIEKDLSIVDQARDLVWSPESLLATRRKTDCAPYRRRVEAVGALWQAYEADLRSRLLLDFSDLIRIVVMEFSRNAELRDHYAKRFVHILVDEFQDTSEGQNQMLRLLSGDGFPHVTVVGDEKQSIYRWRNARVENIREFPGTEKILRTNYRSTQGILDLAYHVLIEDVYFKARAEDIYLTADRGAGDVPICLFHPEGERSSREEAKALGAWILAVTGHLPESAPILDAYKRGTPRLGFGDVAILLRSLKRASGLPEFEAELERLGIPYAIVAGVSKVEENVLELFKSLLRLLVYKDDVRAFLTVVEKKPFALPDVVIHELLREGAKAFALSEVLSEDNLGSVSDAEARALLACLRDALEELDHARSHLDLSDFVTEAMEYTQFFYSLFDAGSDLRVVDSVSKRIFELVVNATERREANLAALIESLETLLDKKQFDEVDAPYLPDGRVKIMTIHQAKGLQFPAVAAPGIKIAQGRSDGFHLAKEEGLFVSDDDNMPGRGTKEMGIYERLKAEKEQEERCLLYVAMTRAKDHLFLSSPLADGMEGKRETFMASILRAVKDHGIRHVEWRKTPQIDVKVVDETKGATIDLSVLIDEWETGRERIRESRAAAGSAQEELQFVSWRALHAFSRCPLQYYYRYIVGIEENLEKREETADSEDRPVERNGDALPEGMTPEEFGGFVHRFLYEWSDAGDIESARVALENLAGRYGLASAVRDGVIERAMDLVSALRERIPQAKEEVFKREWPIQVRVGNLVCHGVIDRVERADQGLRIVDYKVGLPREEYLYQVQFYSWLVSRLLGEKPISAVVAYVHRKPEMAATDVSQDAIDRIESNAERLEDALSTKTYHATPGRVCGSCDFKGICPHAVAQS
jgi:DNA helicase-2/ATP-dependent DNA helicase PcrA